jgi:hypothetical protein
MWTRPEIAALVGSLGLMLAAREATAQPDLPPPPPPPINQPIEVPSLPPPPAPASTSPAAPPRRPPVPAPPPPPPPPYRAVPVHPRRVEEVVYVERPEPRPVAITLNPLGLFVGRLSANVELQIEPHHSFIVAPNVLVFDADRGQAHSLISEGLGFATHSSSSVGVELGYHYWWQWHRALRGPFFGPSLLLGGTSQASAGDPTREQGYWGLAFDVGDQEVLPGGFTVGAGGGLEVVELAGKAAVVPRLLLDVGCSF